MTSSMGLWCIPFIFAIVLVGFGVALVMGWAASIGDGK